MPEPRAPQIAWVRCDGPLVEVNDLLGILVGADLLDQFNDVLRLTKLGRQVATQDHQQGGRLLARCLIETGYFRNQARRLLAAGEVSTAGDFTCRRASAVDVAAQLVGALRRWKEVTLDSHLRIPSALVHDLLDWSLQPIPGSNEDSVRQEIGNRAESYSYRLGRETSDDPSRIRWVALDNDSLGYDIIDGASSPERHIEVKGSQGREVRFFLSPNEWEVGRSLGDAYEVQFWGGITPTRRRAEEFDALRKEGFPKVFVNLARSIGDGELQATPSEYLVTTPAES